MIYARPSSTVEAVLESAPEGLVGTLALRVIDPPAGTILVAETTAGIVESTPGVYVATFTAPASVGDLLIVWRHGTNEAVEQLRVTDADPLATPPPATPSGLLATVDELKRRIHTTGGGQGAASDETLLEELLAAASSRIIELASDRTLHPVPATSDDDPVERRFPVHSAVVQVPDLRSATTVELDGTTLVADDPVGYRLRHPVGEGANTRYLRVRLRGYGTPVYEGGVYEPREPGELRIVGHWGPATIEPHVRDAALTWAARAWHARSARFADAVQDPAGGLVSSYFKTVPGDVAVVLNDLQIPGL